jgi:hypothetical protein
MVPPAHKPAASSRAYLLGLQRTAGNAATVASIQRDPLDGGAAPTGVVHPGRFVNSGTSALGRQLGFQGVGPFFLNGVEIVFDLDPGVRARYRDLRPRQWSGPEGVFFKTGVPLGSPWHVASNGPGGGADDPMPQSQRVTDQAVIFDDSPGPPMIAHAGHTWVHTVQNFTSWVEGVPLNGGSPQRLTEAMAWYSVISVVNPDAANTGAGSRGTYQSMGFTNTGPGWVPVAPPPL